MKVSYNHDDWREIIYCRMENQQIDFKSAQDWNAIGRAGRAKFARHAMALANTLGGYVVVGVGEDSNGNPTLYTGMTDEQSASFDPSAVGQTINRYADPAVAFDVIRPEVDGRRYVVLVVYPFSAMPHVCSDVCDSELQRGVFYIRTPDARSRAAFRASELHGLIQKALRNQRQLLGRMLRGILYENRQGGEDRSDELFASLAARSLLEAQSVLGTLAVRRDPLFEAVIQPPGVLSNYSLTEARRALEGLERPRLNDFPWPGARYRADYYAANESLRGIQKTTEGKAVGFWELYQSGLLYCAAPLPVGEGGNGIQAGDVLGLTLVTVALAGQMYTTLNHQEDELAMTFRLRNTMQQTMLGWVREHGSERRCLIPDVEVQIRRSASDLEAGAATDAAARIFQELCERFNVSLDNADMARLRNDLENYLSRGLLSSIE